MTWPFNLFGDKPAIETLAQDHDEAFEAHRSAVLERAEIAVVDQHGKRLNERRWRDHIEFIGSL